MVGNWQRLLVGEAGRHAVTRTRCSRGLRLKPAASSLYLTSVYAFSHLTQIQVEFQAALLLLSRRMLCGQRRGRKRRAMRGGRSVRHAGDRSVNERVGPRPGRRPAKSCGQRPAGASGRMPARASGRRPPGLVALRQVPDLQNPARPDGFRRAISHCTFVRTAYFGPILSQNSTCCARLHITSNARLHRVKPHYTTLCHDIPRDAILLHGTSHHIATYHTVPHHAVRNRTLSYHTLPYHTTPYPALPCHTVPCRAIPYQ